MRRVDNLRLAMSIGLYKHRRQTVGVFDAHNLIGNDLSCLIPGDTLELAFSSILGIPFSLGIPINALHWIEDAILRIHTILVCVCIWRKHGLETGMKLASSCFDGPRLEMLHGVLFVVAQRACANNFVILHIDLGNIRTDAERVQTRCLDNCFLVSHEILPPSKRRSLFSQNSRYVLRAMNVENSLRTYYWKGLGCLNSHYDFIMHMSKMHTCS